MGPSAAKITYFDGSYYEGDINDHGRENGQGRIYYANGDSLKGRFNDGECTYAIITKKNGDSYQGNMRELKYHGPGKQVTKRFSQRGLFRDNRFVHGKINFTDGSIFEGSIENGKKAGKCTFVASDGSRFEGYFKNDQLHGFAEARYADGSTYSGQFNDGIFDGKGKLTKKEEGKHDLDYEGDFKEGIFHGYGRLFIHDTKDEYTGFFKEGKKHGKGVLKYGNGDIYEGKYFEDERQDQDCRIQLAGGATYKGGIKGNQFHGNGHLVRSNGDYYKGNYDNGKKVGRGTLKIGEVVYDGEFKDDMKHGYGRVEYNNNKGEVFEGYFQNDEKHGLGTLKGDSQHFQCQYKDGLKHGPYVKKIGNDYEEKGEFQNDQMHGQIVIRKGHSNARYRYHEGEKVQDIHVQ